MPSDILDPNTWRDSQPPLPGGITNLIVHELSTYSANSARALAHVMAMATANARDVMIDVNSSWYNASDKDAITAFAVAAIPASASISVLVDR